MQYSQRRQLDAMDRALFKHYRENPHLLEEQRKRSVMESLLAAGTGAGAAAALKGNPTKPWGFLPFIIGATAGTTSAVVGKASRRRQALQDQGIETNLIGSYAKPINEKGERYFT